MIHESIQYSNCQQEVKWFYPIPSRISDGVPVAYSKPKDEVEAFRKRKISESEYLFQIKCNRCNYINEVIYQSDKYL